MSFMLMPKHTATVAWMVAMGPGMHGVFSSVALAFRLSRRSSDQWLKHQHVMGSQRAPD